MPQLQDTNKLILKMVASAFVAANFVYFLVVYLVSGSAAVKGKMVFDDRMPFYLAAGGVIMAMLVKPIREKIWDSIRGRVNSKDSFYQSLMILTIVSMSIAEVIGISGVVFYFMTGNMVYAAELLAVSLVATVAYFPRDSWIEEKKISCGALAARF